MQFSEIARLRMGNQHIGGMELASPKATVSWMGAMQAQDFPMAKWAIGVRSPGVREKDVDEAFDRGELLRTHLLRPTWHLATPEDIYWLLELSAPQIRASQTAREWQLGLTAEVYARSNATLERALGVSGQLSREELILELQKAGIATDQNRASHLFMRAELDQILCSGALQRGKPTYALLAERVPRPRRCSREEALAELAKRYFSSRSPATLGDFSWWSGLTARQARQALDAVKTQLVAEEIDGKTYWSAQDYAIPSRPRSTVHLLPTYDELIVSYAERSASLPARLEQHMKEISDRGVFWPVVVVDGQVQGTWKRALKKEELSVEIQPFAELKPTTMKRIGEAAQQFAFFLGKKLISIPIKPGADH